MESVSKRTEFANRFLSEMGIKGCSATEIAELLGITKQSVSNYTSGKAIPPIDKLHKLADYFDVTLDWLLCRPGAQRAASADMDYFCRYTGLSQKNVENLHRRVATIVDDKYSYDITPAEDWIPALQTYIDYAAGMAHHTLIDSVAEYMWLARQCVELAEMGDRNKIAALSEDELLERWRMAREYYREMELTEYKISKHFGEHSRKFWVDIDTISPNGKVITLSPNGCVSLLAKQYRKKKAAEECDDGEHIKANE